MTKVKICGITNLEDALSAVDLGADMLGFNFYEKSPRYIAPGSARHIVERLGGKVTSVGVFVNEPNEQLFQVTVKSLVDIVQFHGDEKDHDLDLIRINLGLGVIKALRTSDNSLEDLVAGYGETSFLIDGYLPEKYGGTGTVANWTAARGLVDLGHTVYLAGGLTPVNVADAVKTVRPYAVDVAGGVESSPGKKDPNKVEAFIRNAKNA